MDKRPELERLSASARDALMTAWWAEVQRLKARLATLEAKPHEPGKDAHYSRVPPSQTPQPNLPTGPRTRPRREASVGRAGGGRPLHPDAEVCVQVMRPSRGYGVIQELLGDHRPMDLGVRSVQCPKASLRMSTVFRNVTTGFPPTGDETSWPLSARS